MGNVTGRSAAAARGPGSDWRGPFSDEEFSCLSARFKEAVAGKQRAEVEKSCQAWLDIEAPTATPNEVSSVLKRVGAAFCRLSDRHAEGNAMSERAFAETVAQCTRASSQSVLRSLFALFASPENEATLSSTETTALLLAVLCMADASSMVEDGDGAVAAANTLAESAIRYSGQGADSSTISQDEFVRWASAQCPLLYTVFVSWMAHRSFHSLARISFVPPSYSHKSQILSRANFVNLSMATTALQQPLDRLYTSAQDGLSFNRLCYHVLGYSGPTLVIIQDTEGAVFGMFCDTEWKESSRFFGGNGCFLFRSAPDFRLYRVTPSGANENYMYLNSKGYALPRGLGMGGDTNSFRLFLSEDFDENSYTTPKDLSFEQGALSSRKKFLINAMEVWGCGGDDARASQGAHRQETAELINRARKVDKAQFVGSDFDKEMFLGKTFGHGTDRGRIADDEH